MAPSEHIQFSTLWEIGGAWCGACAKHLTPRHMWKLDFQIFCALKTPSYNQLQTAPELLWKKTDSSRKQKLNRTQKNTE